MPHPLPHEKQAAGSRGILMCCSLKPVPTIEILSKTPGAPGDSFPDSDVSVYPASTLTSPFLTVTPLLSK